MEKCPCLEVTSPPIEVTEIPKPGGKVWQSVNPSLRDMCEDAVQAVKQRIMKRRILLKPVFRDFDIHNNGHVGRSQMRQCLSMNGILLSDEELYALEERFNDDLGFNYSWFLREAEPKKQEDALYAGYVEDMVKLNAPKTPREADRKEKDIVQILAKIKAKVVRERIRVSEFLKEYDRCNLEIISRSDFKRGLTNSRLELSENEVDTLMDVFGSPKRRECVDYKRFSNVVEESFTQQCLERAPLLVPLQHVPGRDCERNFLNFEERRSMAVAMEKLSNKPDLQTNIMSIFEDYDKTRCGTVSQEQFLKALAIRGMYNLISRLEFDIICKCFGFERGLRDEVDYRAFIKALDIIHANNKYLPF